MVSLPHIWARNCWSDFISICMLFVEIVNKSTLPNSIFTINSILLSFFINSSIYLDIKNTKFFKHLFLNAYLLTTINGQRPTTQWSITNPNSSQQAITIYSDSHLSDENSQRSKTTHHDPHQFEKVHINRQWPIKSVMI